MRADDLLDARLVQTHVAQVDVGLKGCQQLDERASIIGNQEFANTPLPADKLRAHNAYATRFAYKFQRQAAARAEAGAKLTDCAVK